MDYYDFVLRLSPSGEPGNYNVHAESKFAGVATGKFHSPFTDLELENFILKVGRTRRGVRRINSPQWHAAKSFGETLYSTLFAEDIRANYISSRNAALHEGKGLRVKFIVDAPDLTNYPWEFLYDRSSGRFLCLYEATPVIRYVELPSPLQLLRVAPPLRILAVASSPGDYEPLNILQEKKNLDSALGDLVAQKQVVVDWLPAANLGALRGQLLKHKYHIFHFIGHGGFDDATQDGQLIFENEAGTGNPINGDRLAVFLANHPSLRLAVLNACEGGRASTQDPFASVAMTFVRNGDLAAVVAMQFEVTDDASVRFSQGFYSSLAVGAPVDAAVTQGRLAIFDQHNDIEWGTPVLYLRAPDGVIFAPLSAAEVAAIERERTEQEQREKLRLEQEAAERAAQEKAALERAAVLEFERQQLAQKQQESEQRAREQAAQEQQEREQAKQEQLAREKAETERLASEKAEADRVAREQANADRIARIAGLYQAAQQSFADKKYDQAIRSLEALLALDSSNGPALKLMAKAQAAQQEQERQEYQNAYKVAGRNLGIKPTLREELVERAEWVRASPMRLLGLGAFLLLACIVCTALTNSIFPTVFGTLPTSPAALSQPTVEAKSGAQPPIIPTLFVPEKGVPTAAPAPTQNAPTPTSVPTENASTPTPVPTENASTLTPVAIFPAPTPNGGGRQIAFVKEIDGLKAIFLVNADGKGDTRQLTRGDIDAIDPAWSPDGKQIAYAAIRNGEYKIHLMNADGTGDPFLLTSADGNHMAPAWSNDGERIAFTSTRSNFDNYCNVNRIAENSAACNFDIYVINRDGTSEQPLVVRAGSDAAPAWSPNDREIAFESNAGSANGEFAVYLVGRDGSNLRKITESETYIGAPAWFCCQNALLVTALRDGKFRILKLVLGASTTQTQLSSDEFSEGCARLSPDNTQIVFQRQVGNTTDSVVSTMHVANRQAQQIEQPAAYFLSCPVWSPH